MADHTRDSFIKDRSTRVLAEPEGSKPSMLMDAQGIPHAFCLSSFHSLLLSEKANDRRKTEHSEVVAAMAKDWVEDVIRKHETASKS